MGSNLTRIQISCIIRARRDFGSRPPRVEFRAGGHRTTGNHPPDPALHRFHVLGRHARLAGFLRPTEPRNGCPPGSTSWFAPFSLPCRCSRLPPPTLPSFHPNTDWQRHPNGPLMAHLDSHFTPCSAPLEKANSYLLLRFPESGRYDSFKQRTHTCESSSTSSLSHMCGELSPLLPEAG